MKTLSEPSSRKLCNRVAFICRYGKCQRELVTPKNTWSPARDHMHGYFGRLSRARSPRFQLLPASESNRLFAAG